MKAIKVRTGIGVMVTKVVTKGTILGRYSGIPISRGQIRRLSKREQGRIMLIDDVFVLGTTITAFANHSCLRPNARFAHDGEPPNRSIYLQAVTDLTVGQLITVNYKFNLTRRQRPDFGCVCGDLPDGHRPLGNGIIPHVNSLIVPPKPPPAARRLRECAWYRKGVKIRVMDLPEPPCLRRPHCQRTPPSAPADAPPATADAPPAPADDQPPRESAAEPPRKRPRPGH